MPPLVARFMGPIWGRQDPGGPHVAPMNLAVWDASICHRVPGPNFYHRRSQTFTNAHNILFRITQIRTEME